MDDVVGAGILNFSLENNPLDLVTAAVGKNENTGLAAEFIPKCTPGRRQGATPIAPVSVPPRGSPLGRGVGDDVG